VSASGELGTSDNAPEEPIVKIEMEADEVFAAYRYVPLGSMASPFGLIPSLGNAAPSDVSTPAFTLKPTMDPSFPTCPPEVVT
jgi:hypothetical protein